MKSSSVRLRPILKGVLLRCPVDPDKIGSLYTPEIARRFVPKDGFVAAVGNQVSLVQPGDHISFHIMPDEIELDGETLYMLKESDVDLIIHDYQ